jgi:hypothetical protein
LVFGKFQAGLIVNGLRLLLPLPEGREVEIVGEDKLFYEVAEDVAEGYVNFLNSWS